MQDSERADGSMEAITVQARAAATDRRTTVATETPRVDQNTIAANQRINQNTVATNQRANQNTTAQQADRATDISTTNITNRTTEGNRR